jgi:hypothetical protein
MQCYPETTVDSDKPYWLSRENFLAHFDQEDFLCRESQEITNAYLASWFVDVTEQPPKFMLPTVQLIGGKTQFINGRHRTAVLFSALSEIPIAVSRVDQKSEELFQRLSFRQLNTQTLIEIPDFAIQQQLP